LKAFKHLGNFHAWSKLSTWMVNMPLIQESSDYAVRRPLESLDESGADSEVGFRLVRGWVEDPELLNSGRTARPRGEERQDFASQVSRPVVLRELELLSTEERWKGGQTL
jgi:hypothetical protein